MPSPWIQRKQTELQSKFRGLAVEFAYWMNQSDPATANDPERRFQIHYSQIRLLVNRLESLGRKVSKLLAANQDDEETLLANARNAEALTLAIHRLWGFFRVKFTQRLEERFRSFLAVADQLAWTCYKPFRQALYDDADPRCKEPPLVYLNGGVSPFAMSRQMAFEGELVPDEPLSGPFLRFLEKLPVPVIGVPWYQVDHLPDILVVAHEVGHTVEEDFGLRPAILNRIAEALESPEKRERQSAWESWAGEIFADLFGCAACGPAFVSTLSDFLACDTDRSLPQPKSSNRWGDYPATDLRMQINFAGLRELNFLEDAKRLDDEWRDLAGAVDHGAFALDVQPVVRALLKTTLKPLPDSVAKILPAFTPEEWAERTGVFEGIKDRSVQSAEARILLSAMRWNYDSDPLRYLDPEESKVLVEKIHHRMEQAMNVRSDEAQQVVLQKLLGEGAAADDLFLEFESLILDP